MIRSTFSLCISFHIDLHPQYYNLDIPSKRRPKKSKNITRRLNFSKEISSGVGLFGMFSVRFSRLPSVQAHLGWRLHLVKKSSRSFGKSLSSTESVGFHWLSVDWVTALTKTRQSGHLKGDTLTHGVQSSSAFNHLLCNLQAISSHPIFFRSECASSDVWRFWSSPTS